MNTVPDYQEVTETQDIPKHAGIEGFILAIRSILKMPRIANINIDNKGKVTFTRYARVEEPRRQIEVDFESVAPSAIVRNGHVVEVDADSFHGNAAICVAALFSRAAQDHMYPVAWVVGANTVLPSWHALTTGVVLPTGSAYGLPVLRDRFIPDEALILACAYGQDAALIDARQAYKVTMPSAAPPLRLPESEVSVTPEQVPPVTPKALP